MGAPIDHKEIRKGDRVREITRITSHRDYTADMDGNTLNRYGNGDKSWELLDRPRKLIHAKGTTLYLKRAHGDAKTGDPVTVREDYFEDQHMVQAIQANGFKDGYPYEYWLTTEKPRVLKWAKGTVLYVLNPIDDLVLYEAVEVLRDTYEDQTLVYVERSSFPSRRSEWYTYRFTDVKPEPHPVGAIRWVTQDCKSPYYYEFKKGDRVEVNSHERFDSGNYTVVVSPQTGDDRSSKWINPKFLSETLVEPKPTIVAVPLPAIEKLRDENDRAYDVFGQDAKKNSIRRNAIDHFLNNTREVKTALRGDDEW